jgi:DNA/RNA endonuclease YhcR with UshA esterase domain
LRRAPFYNGKAKPEIAQIGSKCHDFAVRCLNYFRELSVAALLALALAAKVSAQTNAPGAPPKIPAAAATNFLNQEVVVTDRVAQVTLRPTIAFLNLNQNYPDSPLTCVIRGRDTNKFPDLKNYLGRAVEISGRITDYQGRPEIVLTATNQVTILNDIQPQTNTVPPAIESVAKVSSVVSPMPGLTQATANIALSAPPVAGAEKIPDRAAWWIVGSLGAIVGLLILLVFLFWKQSRSAARAAGLTTALVKWQNDAATKLSVEDWKQRALVAEAMAGRQGQMLREKIMPELAEFAKQSLVQGLYAQRNALMETQQKAQEALTQLESQLTALHLPLQERIRAYEKRIAELEKEVEMQGAEVRELTRATLVLVRKKLEDEKELGRAPGRFN